MSQRPMSHAIVERLRRAAGQLGTADPTPFVRPLMDRTFALPEGDRQYADNALTPGTAPFEPSFSELQPGVLRFTIEPLGPGASGQDRRDEATREMRRLVRPCFGPDALRWFDQRSEEWRTAGSGTMLNYGAFFGNSFDRDGLYTSKVYYEIGPHQMRALPLELLDAATTVQQMLPQAVPLFTTIGCQRERGQQRLTFLHRGALRLRELGPVLEQLRLGHQLPGIMQILGVALGGRFDLPERSVLLAIGHTDDGPEFEIYVLLGMVPDVPANFLDLLALGLTERPRELQALGRWLRAFTPEREDWPGHFSVLSIHAAAHSPPRVSLYLRPVEFEISDRMEARREREDTGT
ncbi:hypothetical protein ABD05_14660 [Burkholderia pyrrocinia]|nr:hypothetical protein ABD05_14660 [Burkholderia pyrrocinia]